MSRQWRALLFVPLAIMLVITAAWLSSTTRPEFDQDAKVAFARARPQPAKPKPVQAADTTRMIPVYASGSLLIPEAKSTPKSKPKRSKKRATIDANASDQKIAPDARPTEDTAGKRPQLVVSYEAIGFERYLTMIEKVGRFFLLIRTEKGIAVGPEVSIDKSVVLPRLQSTLELLAANRPHLVSDPRIQTRLGAIGLPPNAVADRAALLLTKPFDALLWDVIKGAVSSAGHGLSEVVTVRGKYYEEDGAIILRLEAAILRDTEGEIVLNRSLRVTL